VKLTLKKINDAYIKIGCETDLAYELSEYFTFLVPGAKFNPKVKNKIWDGKIRLFNLLTKRIYAGLKLHVELFARERGYEVEYEDPNDFAEEQFSEMDALNFIKSINLKYEPRDYQLAAFVHGVRTKRSLLLSPTASGKSLIIYLLSRYYHTQNNRVLIVVPTTSLVHQMASDFGDYSGLDPDKFCHKIYSGEEKDNIKPFTITTWQSIYKMPPEWFQQFKVVIGDEAHLFKAKSLTGIMDQLIDCSYRFGFTGTLDGTQTHKLVLEGLFGPVKKVTTTAELIEQKHLSEFKIKAIVLSYPDEQRQVVSKYKYREEIDFLVENQLRNQFIVNLAEQLKGNTLILYQLVEKQGEVLYNMLSSSAKDVFFISGNVDGLIREDIRQAVETKDNCIIVASYGTFSTGVNIKNLHNVIFASPSKSRIRNLQSIGRGSLTKAVAVLYDIADDLSWKSKKNFTLSHFAERIRIYNEEKFEYKIYTVKLKEQHAINNQAD
jgi:superfamily II DNA or RNA helicase